MPVARCWHPLLVLLLSCSLVRCASAEDTWREVQSPHFRVLTDGSDKDARKVAFEFEQMHYVFSLLLNTDKINAGSPLTIIAARNASTMQQLEPALYKARGDQIAGEFHHGWEKQFVTTRLDEWQDQNQVVIYHEYTHSVMHANTHWLPTWLDEGVAEFYAYTRMESDKIFVGAPTQRFRALRGHPLLPVTEMMTLTQRSPYYRDEDKTQLFYGESWAMVHYMMFGPGMGNGLKLNQFIHELQDQVPQEQAFRQTFGDPNVFDSNLEGYIRQFTLSAAVLPPLRDIDPKTFQARALTPAEADYELACFHIGSRDYADGRKLLDQALALNPKLAGAYEELGFLDFQAGKDTEAHDEWEKASTLDPDLPRTDFALLMTSKPLAAQSPDQLRTTRSSLLHITALAPGFAPAYEELALVDWRLGSMQQAFRDARTGEQLQPWRAGYHLLTAQILLHGNQPATAATFSRYVAAHWYGPDHNEAVDLWQAVPVDKRGDGPALAFDVPAGSQIARGTLTELTCSGTAGPEQVHLTLLPESPAGPAPLSFTSDGRFMLGFSDTFWWGEDHFSRCHHLDGHPAVIAYKQGEHGPQLLDLELRDDLPQQPPATLQAATAPASSPSAAPSQPSADGPKR